MQRHKPESTSAVLVNGGGGGGMGANGVDGEKEKEVGEQDTVMGGS